MLKTVIAIFYEFFVKSIVLTFPIVNLLSNKKLINRSYQVLGAYFKP